MSGRGITKSIPRPWALSWPMTLPTAYEGKAFIVNPPDTDEFDLIARVSGLADVPRESKSHPLNQKEVAHRHAASLGKRYEDLNLVISHIGGGVSVTAHKRGRMIDSRN